MPVATSPRRLTTSRSRPSSSPAQKRARLRVVPKSYRSKAARRRRVRRILAATSVSVCATFFMTLTFQVMLTQGQFRLQRLHDQIAVQRQTFATLRAQVGQLESPSRILEEATSRFGMQQPTHVQYLQPVRPISVQTTVNGDGDGLSQWSEIKRLQAAVR